jgi:ubiquinone/menaquinone biosynthesis C-methylase UbiE
MGKTDQRYIPALRFRIFTPFYDLVQRLFVGDKHYKGQLIERADLRPGQRVLDIGCGTGTLAMMVKLAQPDAEVRGLDADPQMLKVAHAKAAQYGLDVEFTEGFASELPYPDASFDRVLSTLMIHHLKTADKEAMAREIFRVLKRGGRMHVLDFGKPRNAYSKVVGLLLRRFEEAEDNVAGALPGIFARGGLAVQENGNYSTFFGSLTFLEGRKAE